MKFYAQVAPESSLSLRGKISFVENASRVICTATFFLVSVAVFAHDGDGRLPHANNYEVFPLTLNGMGCRVQAIQSGRAVGWCRAPDATSRAFVWTKATGVVDVGTLGGLSASASSLDRSVVVGGAEALDNTFHAVAWTRGTGMLDLGTLGGTYAAANSVSGENVVGTSYTAAEQAHAFLWTPSAGMMDLGTLEQGDESVAFQIHGDLIAGYSKTSVPGYRPVAWRTNGEIIDLVGEPIELDGIFVRGDGLARAVRHGLVVGDRRVTSTEESHAFAWREGQGLIDLGVVPGSNESFAYDTDGVRVVGQLSGPFPNHTTRAFIWSASLGMKAITPVSISAWATHIRNERVIGIYYTSETNGQRTFLWTKKHGLSDVTPRYFSQGAAPAGIDEQGNIALVYEDEFPLSVRSAILIPRH